MKKSRTNERKGNDLSGNTKDTDSEFIISYSSHKGISKSSLVEIYKSEWRNAQEAVRKTEPRYIKSVFPDRSLQRQFSITFSWTYVPIHASNC